MESSDGTRMPSCRAAVIAPIAISSQPGDDRGGPGCRVRQQGERGLVSARNAERRGTEVVRVHDPGLVHRGPEPAEAPGVHVEVHLLFQIAAQVHDPGVPEADEVAGGEPGRLLVVDAERGDPGDGSADAHRRAAQGLDQFHLARREGHPDADDGIHALAHEEVMEQPAALFRFGRKPEEGEVVAGADQRPLDALEHLGEEPAVDERGDDADVLGAPGHEARGGR